MMHKVTIWILKNICFPILLPKPKEFMETASQFITSKICCIWQMTQNLHSSLNDISAFKFENYLHIIKKSIRNTNNPVAQIAKRKPEVESHCTQMHKKENEIKCSIRFQDSCFRHNNKSVFVKRRLDDTR